MIEDKCEAKSINTDMLKPIALNCWKHHLGYVKSILNNRTSYTQSEIFIHEVIQFIGKSQFDIYKGNLDVTCISNEVIGYLKSINVTNQIEYKEFIYSEGKEFKCIPLSDGSNWTLRLGQSDDRYIHIHPSRHSKKSLRVKSSTLKTVYAFLFYYGLSSDEISIEKVNYVRNKYVKLPALKPTSALIAISRIYNLFIV